MSAVFAVVLWIASSAVALAQAEGATAPHSPWISAARADVDLAAARRYLDELPPERRPEHLRAAGSAFFDGHPEGMTASARRRCVELHAPLLAAVATSEPALVEWFAVAAATFLADGGDCDGALAALQAAEALVPSSQAFAFERSVRRIDCMVELQHLAAADRACEAAGSTGRTDLQRAQLLAQRGSINVMLGRLDLASRSLAAAVALVEQDAVLAGEPTDAGFALTFDLLLRQLDLATAREQPAAARSRIDAFVQRVELAGRSLSADERMALRVHEAAAAYLSSQRDGSRRAATIAELEALLAVASLPPRYGELLAIWLADLELRRGGYDAARAALQRRAALPATRRGDWALAPAAAELARRTDAGRELLLQHERHLRDVLQQMIAEWREVAWEQETTGFLRLGSRLRVVAELVGLTAMLHGGERALDDVMALQRCTTVSRARQAPESTLAELRQQVLTGTHGALVFVPSWGESHVFAFDREQLVHARLPHVWQLREQVQALRQELHVLDAADAGDLQDLVAASRRVSASLLPAPVRAVMGSWQHVTISGQSLLDGLPFECLEWEPGALLGERFAVATTASLPLLFVLRRDLPAPAAAAHVPMQLFATLQPAAEFAVRNGIAAAGEFGGPAWQRLLAALPVGTEPRLGERATVSAWRQQCEGMRPGVSLLIAHGEPPVDERPAALGFAADGAHAAGLLTPAVIQAVPQRGLVVVSACDAARGPVRMGDDDTAATLAGAFLFAGASAVVAASVPLRASVHLAVDAVLLEELTAGSTPAEALRRARVAVAAGDPATAFRVAQISVVGWGGSPLVVATPGRPWWPWLLAILVLVSCLRAVRTRGRAGSR